MKLYAKLLEIQKRINGLGKDKAGNNYRYVTGDKVLGEIKPLMNEFGLLLKQEVLSIENVRQDYLLNSGKGKAEMHSKVMMRFTWIDCETGERDENLFGANGQNDWDKGLGSALTYAERYFLLKFFHIATDEDDIDNPDRKPQEKEVINKVQTLKPVFDINHPDFKKSHKAISEGTRSIADLQKKFEVSESTIKILTSNYTE